MTSTNRLDALRPRGHRGGPEVALALGLICAVALSFLGWLVTSSASFQH